MGDFSAVLPCVRQVLTYRPSGSQIWILRGRLTSTYPVGKVGGDVSRIVRRQDSDLVRDGSSMD